MSCYFQDSTEYTRISSWNMTDRWPGLSRSADTCYCEAIRDLPLPLSSFLKPLLIVGHQLLMPVILATQEAEIRKIAIQSQSQANISWGPILKIPITKKDWPSVSSGRAPAQQMWGPQFKPDRNKSLTPWRTVLGESCELNTLFHTVVWGDCRI
jgi:hypothetical protein